MLNKIRKTIGKFILKHELKKTHRTKLLYSLDTARTIGIIYTYKSETELKLIEDLMKQLQLLNKELKLMLYLPPNVQKAYIHQTLSIDLLSRSHLNWFFKPIGSYVNDFENRAFDILIDLNITDELPLNWICKISKAKYKVGLFNDDKKADLDLLIKMDEGFKLSELIGEILRYLKMIQP